MTAITVDQARQMGRDRMPLRLESTNRTFVLRQSYTDGGGIVAQIEVGKGFDAVVAQMAFKRGDSPFVTRARFGRATSDFPIAMAEVPLIDAWLVGYYATT